MMGSKYFFDAIATAPSGLRPSSTQGSDHMNAYRSWPLGLVLITGLLAVPSPAPAAESYDNCTGFVDSVPATISTQGTWCLRGDLATGITSGAAITLNANNVTLDCNHFKLGGLAGGLGTQTNGVVASGRYNATLRNCSIRGFRHGVYLVSGGGHLVENNRFDGNTYIGIGITAGPSTIRGNSVVDTGLSIASNYVAGIDANGGTDVIDNTINGVAAGGTGVTAFGIRTNGNGLASVSGNRVRGLAPSGTGLAYGIYNYNSGRMVIRENDLQGTGSAGSVGIRCIDNAATARDNVVAGFTTAVEACLSSGNTLNVN